ncbi:MAG: hypothetical protein AAB400_00525 [Patescibacteria group bacterium]
MNYRIVIVILSIVLTAMPLNVYARPFDPNTIIPDSDFFRTDEMSVPDIQLFLEQKGSALQSYRTLDSDGVVRSASEIIYRAGTTHGINPKVLLVLLQKEQSLIENPNPTQYNYDWATGFARCDSCSPNDPIVAAYKGFGTQVAKAAWRKWYYTTHWNEFAARPNQTLLIDGIPLTPSNAATAALYNYTPHLRGNVSFWKLWNRYFNRVFPDGTTVQASSNKNIWLIQDGKRRLFTSLSAFHSRFDMRHVVFITQEDLEKYPIGTPIQFPQYSLLQIPGGAVFLYAQDALYGIPSKKIFRTVGFNPDEVIAVSAKDITDIPVRGLVSDALSSPIGELMQDIKTGGIYYTLGSVKHPLLERAVLSSNFPARRIKSTDLHSLEKYESGEPIMFNDGTLVKSSDSSTVYVISNKQKRPIASEYVFTSLGYQWSNIIQSNGRTLEMHLLGDPIDLGAEWEEESPAIALKTP